MTSAHSRWIGSALFFLLLSPNVVIAYAQCYYPDGSEAKDFTFVECYTPSAEPEALSRHAPCCIPSEGDICRSNGLCYRPGGKVKTRMARFPQRPAKISPDSLSRSLHRLNVARSSLQFISICADSKPRNATWMYVQKCEGDGWQCGALKGLNHNLALCIKKHEEFEDMIQTKTTSMAALTTFGRASTIASSIIPSATDTENTETSATSALSTNSSGELSKGAIAGIAIGGWAAFTFIGTLAWWCGRGGKGQASSAPPAHTHAWEDDPWNQNTSGFGQTNPQMGMVHYGSVPSYVADGDGGIYAAISGFGAAARYPNESEGTHEAAQEIKSDVGGSTLVPIGLAIAAQNNKVAGSGSPLYANPSSASGRSLSRYQRPLTKHSSEQRNVAEMNGRATGTR